MPEGPGGPEADGDAEQRQVRGIDAADGKSPTELTENKFSASANRIADHFGRLDTTGVLVKRQNQLTLCLVSSCRFVADASNSQRKDTKTLEQAETNRQILLGILSHVI